MASHTSMIIIKANRPSSSEACKRKDELSSCRINNSYYYSSSSLRNSRQSSSPSISNYSSPIASPRLNPSRIPSSPSFSNN
ncbi:7397_t:CDS:2 [Entrophospora sp. SA101]|nr:7397_t:CDS:2 [Entrophospora sp. SA101]CAJ0841155.1 1871_t:CDS:2 [Entrophospora sp. SA101]CAJ0841167.1 1875_t:CDS:2 [Entrophospora sp. SA101]CAJ0841178.1 1879_t:CDS:2 [Entrophospora sp. SA101]